MRSFTLSKITAEIKACLALAIPLAGAQLSQSATAFVDTLMMGWLGRDTIAAGGLGATTFNTLLIIGMSIAGAVSPLVAEAYGAGQPNRVERVVRQGFWLALLLAIPATVLLWNAAPLLQRLGQGADTVALSERYLRAIAWGFFPSMGFAVLRHFVSALSLTRPIIITIIGGTLLNITGNYILMLGKFGFPALGIAGLGWASTLSMWATFLGLSAYVLSQSHFKIYRPFQDLHRFEWRVFRELLRVGLPIGGLSVVEVGLFSVTTILMGQLGTVPLAAHQIALQTVALSFMVPLGISFATTVRVGQQLGQGDPKAAQLAGYVGIALSGLFMCIMGTLFWTLPEQIVSLYLNVNDPANADVVPLAKALLAVAAVFQIADGIQVTAAGALRGLKDTYIPMVIGAIAYWGIGLPSGYTLGIHLGFGGTGLWCGLAIGLVIAAAVLTWRFSMASGIILKPVKSEC